MSEEIKNKIIFTPATDPLERCPYCNKKMLLFYSDEEEIMITICKDKKCMYYEAVECENFTYIDLELDNIILKGYFDE